jgi:hypothetical protein
LCYAHVAKPFGVPLLTFSVTSSALGLLALTADHPLPAVVASIFVLLGALYINLYETPCSTVCAFLECGACVLLDTSMRTTAVLALCFGAACHGVLALSLPYHSHKTAV